MEENELRELVVWIAIHVMGWKLREGVGEMQFGECRLSGDEIIFKEKGHGRYKFNPITNGADSLNVLDKCSEKVCVRIRKQFSGLYCVWAEGAGIDPSSPLPPQQTLPLAIAKFAKLLFSDR